MKKLIIVIVGIFLLMPLLSWGQQPSIGEVKSVAKNHLLMQKVEELTLHLIELQKQVNELKNEQK